jgi:hypothetical protein
MMMDPDEITVEVTVEITVEVPDEITVEVTADSGRNLTPRPRVL